MSDTQPGVTLHQRTLELCRSAPKSVKLRHMAEAAECSIAWVHRFRNDAIPEPSIHVVQRLHDFLVNVGKGDA